MTLRRNHRVEYTKSFIGYNCIGEGFARYILQCPQFQELQGAVRVFNIGVVVLSPDIRVRVIYILWVPHYPLCLLICDVPYLGFQSTITEDNLNLFVLMSRLWMLLSPPHSFNPSPSEPISVSMFKQTFQDSSSKFP